MCGGDHTYSGVQLEAWNFSEEKLHRIFFCATYLKLPTTSILSAGGLRSAAREAITSTAQ